MGIAAYNRGSTAIAEQIQRDCMECGGRVKQDRDSLQRAEVKISELEQFCRDAQSLYGDACDSNTAKGIVKQHIHQNIEKKKDTKKFRALREECIHAHNAWVDSDQQYSIDHLQVCYRKARAWEALLAYLNRVYHFPFKIPSHL